MSDPEKVAQWFRYLTEIGELDSYQAACGCYRCKEIVAGFDAWKAKQEAANKTVQE